MKCQNVEKNENSPNGMVIHDLQGNIDHNEFQFDDIKRVCDCDAKHNLNPQNKKLQSHQLNG